jgi:hypothetical protein
MSVVYQNLTDEEKANYDVIDNFIEASYFLLMEKNFTFEELACCTYEEYLEKTEQETPLEQGQLHGVQLILQTMLNYEK